jgi:hypothetical protein
MWPGLRVKNKALCLAVAFFHNINTPFLTNIWLQEECVKS